MSTQLETVIARIGAAQHGVVSRWQLEQAGVEAHVVDYRVRMRRLVPLFRGVYRTGAAPTQFEREIAAVLACGEGAVLSHRSAAAMWGIAESHDMIDVILTRGCRRPGARVRAHRMRGLRREEVTSLYGVPITTLARTVLDLAASTDRQDLEQILARTFRKRPASRDEVSRFAKDNPRRPGIKELRRALARSAEPQLTRSEAEKRALALFRRAELPAPRSNHNVEGFEVDFLWPKERVVAEIDGFAFHAGAAEFERDRLRDAVLAAAGYRVVRITWRQLTRYPEAVIARLAAALAQR